MNLLYLFITAYHVAPPSISHLHAKRAWTPLATQNDVEEDWSALDEWLERVQEPAQPAPASLADARKAALLAQDAGSVREWRAVAAGPHTQFYDVKTTFDAIGASKALQATLHERCGHERPSLVGAAAFYPVLNGEDCIIAHPAGSGKTIAAFAPLVQRLWEIEAVQGRARAGTVRSIVLVPTSELAQQVRSVVQQLANGTLRTTCVTEEHHWSTQRERLSGGLEVCICTLGRMREHLQASPPTFRLSELSALVADECDGWLYSNQKATAEWRQLLTEAASWQRLDHC
mmetsp:Transcript_5449/g.11416  ORF Transcript_5449/g.11416 Transcript_5449/m.11416 type:complete len:288 (-) Transcript_5449:88-951(-)